MKENEFRFWRRDNLLISLVGVIVTILGVIVTIIGTASKFAGHPYGRLFVIVGVLWYVSFYLRYIIVRRWHESDRINMLLDEYHKLKGTNNALIANKGEQEVLNKQKLDALRAQIERVTRRHLLRDINIATILTRRFVIRTVNQYATRYRHELINPILDMVRDGMISEATVIALIDEPVAFADIILTRKDELATACPKLIVLCRDHWPQPEGDAA